MWRARIAGAATCGVAGGVPVASMGVAYELSEEQGSTVPAFEKF